MASRNKELAVAGVLLALGLIAPFTDSFVILLITRGLILAILAMSLDILLGYTGLPSLGQAAYLGMGAYLTAILATRFQFGLDWSFWVVILLGVLLGAATAAIFGLFAIRASGVYFLMITLELHDRRRQRHQSARPPSIRHPALERCCLFLRGVRLLRRVAADALRAGEIAIRSQPGRNPRARSSYADSRVQYMAAQ